MYFFVVSDTFEIQRSATSHLKEVPGGTEVRWFPLDN